MKYDLSLKNIKQSAANLNNFLKEKEYNIPHNIILEAISKVFFFKNWNTLSSLSQNPQQIEYYPIQKKYIFELEASISKEEFLKMFENSFIVAKSQCHIINVLYKEPNIHIELNTTNNTNILTAMFILCDEMKKRNIQVKRFDFCRIECSKESFMEFFSVKETPPKLQK